MRFIRDILGEVLGNVIAWIVLAAIGTVGGFLVGRSSGADDNDRAGKGPFAEIDEVTSRRGDEELGREIHVRGEAGPASLPDGFQLRLGVRSFGIWYLNEDPIDVVDGHWSRDEILGGDADAGAEFVISILLGKEDDFARWFEAHDPENEGTEAQPQDFGIFILADRSVTRDY